MSYKNILVAVDSTDEAGEVLTAARGIANEHMANLTALSVVKPLNYAYSGLDMAPLAKAASFEEHAIQQTKQHLVQLGAEFGIEPSKTEVRLGNPAHEIREHAQQTHTDLIVIGTHGRRGLGLLLGSTANAVLHGVPCDVLAVKIEPARK